jgi:hypothetical protein
MELKFIGFGCLLLVIGGALILYDLKRFRSETKDNSRANWWFKRLYDGLLGPPSLLGAFSIFIAVLLLARAFRLL